VRRRTIDGHGLRGGLQYIPALHPSTWLAATR
jgi:hypothetical protein